MQIHSHFTADSLARFNAMLNRCANETGKSLASIVEKASVYFCQSAGRASPVSKKRRKAELVQRASVRAGRLERWRFQVCSQSAPPQWVYTSTRMDKLRLIKNRGLAGNSWRALIGKFSTRGANAPGGKPARDNVAATVQKTRDMAAVTMTNRIQYMQKVAPNVVPVALELARRRMSGWLASVAAKQKQTWAA